MNNINLQTVQWSSLKDIDDVEPINEDDYLVLEQLKEVIVKNGYTDRFGITLLHRHFNISQDEVVMENTDVENRISTLSVEKDENLTENTIETMWRFSDKPESITKCVLRCHYFLGHKSRHSREGS